MSKKIGIVNVTMVITEEKILSNIDKVQKLINPNNKKKIVQLEEDAYFKDLIESIKTYLIEYPKKKNFPISVYKATYGLVETATYQFEENTKKIEELIKQREENIALAGELKEVIDAVDESEDGWENKVRAISGKISPDIIETLNIIAKCKTRKTKTYMDAMKILNARVNNLESNLHIEIDMERLEDSSKALSYIGIEVADALKLIPTPEEQLEVVAEQNAADIKVGNNAERRTTEVVEDNDRIEKLIEDVSIQEERKQYAENTTFETKPSLWERFKNSKFVRAATFLFRVKVRLELPSGALQEGKEEQ